MLKDKHTALNKHVVGKDEVRNSGQLLQGIGRIGKDEVELLRAAFNETENIATETLNIKVIQLFHALLNEAMVITVFLYANHLTAPT